MEPDGFLLGLGGGLNIFTPQGLLKNIKKMRTSIKHSNTAWDIILLNTVKI